MGLAAAATGLLTSIGVGAETAGILGPILAGSGLGTVGSAITGGDPLLGALSGGALGGVGELFGGGAGGLFGTSASGGDSAATAPALASTTPAAGSAAATIAPSAGVPAAAGVGAGGDISSIAGSTGATGTSTIGSSIAPGAIDLSTAAPGSVSAGGGGLGSSVTGTALAPSGSATGIGGGTGGFTPSPAPALDLSGVSTETPSLSVPADTISGGGSFGSKALSYVGNHPGLALGGLGLGASLLMNSSVPGLDSLQTEAGLLASKGNSASGALQSGELPQGAQAALDQATESAKATVRSRFAGLGLSGSTQEAEALSGIDEQAASQKYEMLLQLTQTGLGEIGAADSLYGNIMNAEIAQDQSASNAISRFAGALAGGGANG